MHSATLLLAFAAAASAILVSAPSTWTSTVSPGHTSRRTDPTTFAALLVNINTTILPSPITLVANETTKVGGLSIKLSITLPTGSGYRVNFVDNVDSPNSILAQSTEFEITGSGSSSSTSSTQSSASSQSSAGTSSGASVENAAASTDTSFSAASSSSAVASSSGASHLVGGGFAATVLALGLVFFSL